MGLQFGLALLPQQEFLQFVLSVWQGHLPLQENFRRKEPNQHCLLPGSKPSQKPRLAIQQVLNS